MKKTVKNILVIMMMLVLSFSLVACGGQSNQAANDGGDADQTAQVLPADDSAPADEAKPEEPAVEEPATEEQPAATEQTVSIVDKAKSAGKIIMGTNAEFKPFEYVDVVGSKEEIVGFDVDIAKAIAKKMGVELEITNMAFDGLIAALQSGKIDFIAAGMTATKERAESVSFSDSYFKASQVIIVKKGNDQIKGKADLKGKVIGVQLGTTGDEVASEKEVGAKEVKRYKKSPTAINDVATGKIDAVVLDQAPAKAYVEQNKDKLIILTEPLTEENYSLAAPKGDEALAKIMNEVIKELKDSGEYNKLAQKYDLTIDK